MNFKGIFLLFVFVFCTKSQRVDISDFGRNVTRVVDVPDFSNEIYNKILNNHSDETVLISPLSIQILLGLIFTGAEDKTAEEISDVLGLGNANFLPISNDILKLFQSYQKSTILKISNKIYTQIRTEISPSFKDVAKDYFNSEFATINFERRQLAAEEINSWVAENSRNQINEFVSFPTLNMFTSMLLVNVIHFQDEWNKELIEVTNALELDNRFEDDVWKANIVKLNFKYCDLSLVLVLPQNPNDFSEIERKVRKQGFINISKQNVTNKGGFHTLKSHFEFSINLNDILSSMGMKTMFSNNANFDDLFASEVRFLRIANVFLKASITINEYGVQAGVASFMQVASVDSPTDSKINDFASDTVYFGLVNKLNVLFSGKIIGRKNVYAPRRDDEERETPYDPYRGRIYIIV